MNYSLINEIFQACIIPLLTVLTSYVIKYVKVKEDEIKASVKNELEKKYIEIISDTVTKCVLTTNQTYVDALKDKESFSKNSQNRAFQQTLTAVKLLLNDEIKAYIVEVYSDIDEFLKVQIEATVNSNK